MRNNPYIVSVISFISIAFLFMVSAGTAYAVDSINHYAYLSLEGDSNSLYNLTDLSPSSDPSYLCTSDAGDGTGCFSRYMEKGLSLFDVYDDSGNSLGTMTLDGVVFATLNEDGTFSGDNVMMWGNADLNLVYDNVTYNNTYGIVLEYWGPASSAFALLNYPDLNVTQFNVDMTKLISENKIIITGQNDTVVQSLEDSRDYEINVDGLGEIGFLNVTESLESALTDKPDLKDYQVFVGNIKTDNKLIYAWGKAWQNTTSNKFYRIIYGYVTEEYVDADNDSYYSDVDCNDSDAAIHPAASDDTNDGIDNDCNGAVDEGYSAPSDDGDDDSGSDGGTAYSPPSNILQADIPQKVIPVEATPVQPAQNKAAIPAETEGNANKGFLGMTGAVIGAVTGNANILKSLGVVFWILASLLLALLMARRFEK